MYSFSYLEPKYSQKYLVLDFPGSTVDKGLPANAGGTGSIPSQGRVHILQGN